MTKYKIVGSRLIGDNQPGQIVDSEDLTEANIDALVDGGHLAAHQPTKPKPVADAGEQE